MAFFSEIFFSTLIGKPVYTIDDRYFGNFRDFIVKRQNENFLITKVRIRNHKGQRVILSWKDVHSVEADPVSLKLKKKLSDIKPIDYDEDELRLKRDFLDQQIIDTSKHRVVRVNDLKIVAVQDDFFMVAAEVGLRGILRRIGLENFALWLAQLFNRTFPSVLIPSKYIDPLPARIRHDITLTVAHEQLKQMHPADIADIMKDLDHYERMSILHALPLEIMAKTIEELSPSVRSKLLGKLKDETLAQVLENLSPDAATGIASQLPRRRMRHLLETMRKAEANEILGLLKFQEDTAGRLMNTHFVALSWHKTVKDALDELRKHGDHAAEHIFYLYVTDENGKLRGTISLRTLIFVDPAAHLSALIKHKPIWVKTEASVNEVIRKCTKYNLIVIPVVDQDKKIHGVITVDDILPLLQRPKR